jgi:hypothetical protein
MSFEPTEPETTRPTTDIKPLVPIQPEETSDTPTPPTELRTETGVDRPPRTDYATPYTRDREAIVPGVAPQRST